jgi:transposase
MEILQDLLPNSNLLHLDQYDLDTKTYHLTLHASSTQTTAQCPLSGGITHRIHSHYERTLADLPCVNFKLTLFVHVSKFFCVNPECHRRIFTERFADVAAPWSRKTARLVHRMQKIGLSWGGAAGARLGAQLNYSGCGSTLLNQLQRLSFPEFEVPKVLGVDDFAFRKGCNYGTILVDLERHSLIALLPDRQAETLANWLKEHPDIEILSRDRSKTYKRAMTDGAPQAIQVADRFHLVENLSRTLESTLNGYWAELKIIEQAQHQSIAVDMADTVVVMPQPTVTVKVEQQSQNAHQQRIEQQRTVKALQAQGWSQTAIAQAIGLSIRTIQRYLSQPNFPDTLPRRSTFGKGILDPYKPQLLDWWNSGIRQPHVLIVLLQQNGFTGSERTLQRYIKGLRTAQGLPPVRIKPVAPLPQVIDPQRPALIPN